MTATNLRAIKLAIALACGATPGWAAAHRAHRHFPARGDVAVERLNQAELDRLNATPTSYRGFPPAALPYAGDPPRGAVRRSPPSAGFVPPAYGARIPPETGY